MAIIEWRHSTLGDHVRFNSGGTPSMSNPTYWGGDIPWVSCKDMKTDRLYDAEDHVSEDGIQHGTRLVPAGTILIVVRGMILAKEFPVAITMRPLTFNQDLKAVVCSDEVRSPFLYYWLRAQSYNIMGIADEAAHGTKRIQIDRLLSLPICLPPLATQRKIAAILSAYDDLIENNTRRIRILEDIARALYREWFVHFRFPGSASYEMVESPLGPIPQGWRVVRLGDAACYINRGVSPKYDESSLGMVLNQRCIRDGKLSLIAARRHATFVAEAKRLRFGDVLINSTGIGTLGRVAQVYQQIADCTVDSHVTIVRPSPNINVDYIGMSLLQLEPYFDSMGAGTTGQTELSRASVAAAIILLPPRELQDRFGCAVESARHLAVTLAEHSDNLCRQRDLLLPKLVSGEVDVEGLEIDERDITT